MTGRWVCPVKHDRTRPVLILREWNLTGNDRTLRSSVRSLRSSASGHHLTIEIERSTFEAGDKWRRSEERTLGSCVWSI